MLAQQKKNMAFINQYHLIQLGDANSLIKPGSKLESDMINFLKKRGQLP